MAEGVLVGTFTFLVMLLCTCVGSVSCVIFSIMGVYGGIKGLIAWHKRKFIPADQLPVIQQEKTPRKSAAMMNRRGMGGRYGHLDDSYSQGHSEASSFVGGGSQYSHTPYQGQKARGRADPALVSPSVTPPMSRRSSKEDVDSTNRDSTISPSGVYTGGNQAPRSPAGAGADGLTPLGRMILARNFSKNRRSESLSSASHLVTAADMDTPTREMNDGISAEAHQAVSSLADALHRRDSSLSVMSTTQPSPPKLDGEDREGRTTTVSPTPSTEKRRRKKDGEKKKKKSLVKNRADTDPADEPDGNDGAAEARMYASSPDVLARERGGKDEESPTPATEASTYRTPSPIRDRRDSIPRSDDEVSTDEDEYRCSPSPTPENRVSPMAQSSVSPLARMAMTTNSKQNTRVLPKPPSRMGLGLTSSPQDGKIGPGKLFSFRPPRPVSRTPPRIDENGNGSDGDEHDDGDVNNEGSLLQRHVVRSEDLDDDAPGKVKFDEWFKSTTVVDSPDQKESALSSTSDGAQEGEAPAASEAT